MISDFSLRYAISKKLVSQDVFEKSNDLPPSKMDIMIMSICAGFSGEILGTGFTHKYNILIILDNHPH